MPDSIIIHNYAGGGQLGSNEPEGREVSRFVPEGDWSGYTWTPFDPEAKMVTFTAGKTYVLYELD